MTGQWTAEWVPWVLLALVFVMLPLIVWYLIGWRNRVLRSRKPEQIRLPDGRVLDRDLVYVIGTHSWGESVRRQFKPEEYEHEINCLSCGREILPGQWFWDTPLLDSGGLAFQTCLSCQPGDVAGVTGA